MKYLAGSMCVWKADRCLVFKQAFVWVVCGSLNCFKTKLLMYHKVGFSLFRGDGGWWGGWGGGGVD